MRKRGKVLRHSQAGSGLLMVEGRQYPFSLQPLWKSEQPPKPGLPVDIDFGKGGQIISITTVAESQLSKEKAETALGGHRPAAAFLTKLAARIGVGR